MDSSIFQNENPQSKEEDEELEEQIRRQEELKDLLDHGIPAFTYDDDTVNSSRASSENDNGHSQHSTTSKHYEEAYKGSPINDQLKILYEVRVREINALKEEYGKYQAEKVYEIANLKKKLTLSEAEMRQLQLTQTNLEELLADKTQTINRLVQNLEEKENEIGKLQKSAEEMKIELCTYNATVNELQLKLADQNPFSRNFNSGELQRAHQDQILKLQNLLEEQTKKTEIIDRENSKLQAQLKSYQEAIRKTEEDNNFTVLELTKKLTRSQQQCRDLFDLGEALKKESDHFKERLAKSEMCKTDTPENYKNKCSDKKTLAIHLEKLKSMLLDKDIEMNVLQTKLKFYDFDMAELFEYREILAGISTGQVELCNNRSHADQFLLIQHQLQNYQSVIDEREQQIESLNSVNKELREKIEEVLQQTRKDIKNLSDKYSVPQLEIMSKDLSRAEETIKRLKKELEEKDEDELLMQLDKAYRQIDEIQQNAKAEKKNLEEKINLLQTDLKRNNEEIAILQNTIHELKVGEATLLAENKKIGDELNEVLQKMDPALSKDPDCAKLQEQLAQVRLQLEKAKIESSNGGSVKALLGLKKKMLKFQKALESSEKIHKSKIVENLQDWDESLNNLIGNFHNITTQKLNESELKENIEELSNAKTMLEGEKFALEYQLKKFEKELEVAKASIAQIAKEKENVQDELRNCKDSLQISEANRAGLEEQLDTLRNQMNALKQNEVSMINDHSVRESLISELKEKGGGDENFEARLLKAELALREHLQQESLIKLKAMEDKYRAALIKSNEFFNGEMKKTKAEEGIYRKQISDVLAKCSERMFELEQENAELTKQTVKITKACEEAMESQLKKVIEASKSDLKALNEKWESHLEQYRTAWANMEKQCMKRIKTVALKCTKHQNKIDETERIYNMQMDLIKSRSKLFLS